MQLWGPGFKKYWDFPLNMILFQNEDVQIESIKE